MKRWWRWPWRHRHKTEPVGIRHLHGPSPGLGMMALAAGEAAKVPLTAVLLRCSCGAVDTIVLTGHWSLDEVKGMTAGDVAGSLLEASRG